MSLALLECESLSDDAGESMLLVRRSPVRVEAVGVGVGVR